MKKNQKYNFEVVLTWCMVLPGVMVSAENMDNVQVNTNEENQIATDGSENRRYRRNSRRQKLRQRI